jgi:hypothetical protein
MPLGMMMSSIEISRRPCAPISRVVTTPAGWRPSGRAGRRGRHPFHGQRHAALSKGQHGHRSVAAGYRDEIPAAAAQQHGRDRTHRARFAEQATCRNNPCRLTGLQQLFLWWRFPARPSAPSSDRGSASTPNRTDRRGRNTSSRSNPPQEVEECRPLMAAQADEPWPAPPELRPRPTELHVRLDRLTVLAQSIAPAWRYRP